MHSYRLISIVFLMAVIAISIGCSSGGIQTPLINAPSGQSEIQSASLPVGVSDWYPDDTPAGGMGEIGIFSLLVDPTQVSADLSSLRQGKLTDVLEVVDITNFLRLAPCSDCAKIKSVSLNSAGQLVVSIGLKHPFKAGDPFKPITGQNRADLHVFNVEGIIISNTGSMSFPALGQSIADFQLVNADGYTAYLDNSLEKIYPTAATIHPYITHFDDYSAGNFAPGNPTGFESVTAPGPSGNLVMAMGCEYNYQDYVFDLNGPTDFIYAIGCTYAVSAANKSKRFQPEYRIPQHNKKAASEVSIEIINNELGGGIVTSTANVEIKVVDINHGVAVGTALNEMFADSSVGSIRLEIPGVLATPIDIPGNSSISGTGHDPSDPLVYPATITNTAGGDTGTYAGLIKVVDTYSPGQNTAPLLNGMDGIKRVGPTENPLTGLFQISEFATYQMFKIQVGPGGEAPVCDLQTSDDTTGQGGTITANPGTSYDPDGSITSYEYDASYDGITFNPEIVQLSGDPDFGDPVTLQMPCNSTGDPLIIQIAMRICDDSQPTSMCTICTKDITVTEKLGDAGDITIIAINRGEGGANSAHITSVDLDWEDNPCGVAEYAIERGDGWSGTGWTVIGTTTTSDYKFQLAGNDWDDDIRLRVISRAVVGGDPASDSDPSEEVFLWFISNNGHEVPGNRWVYKTEIRNQSVFEMAEWMSASSSDPGADFDNWWGTNSGVYALGVVAWGYFVEHTGYTASTDRWSIVRSPFAIPDLEGQKEAFCDGYFWTNNAWASGSQGLCVGTVSNPNPDQSAATLDDFKPANDVYGSGQAYNSPNISGLNNEFVETNQSGYQLLGGSSGGNWPHIGYYLNDLLDPDRDYASIGMAVGSTPLPDRSVTVGWSDAWVFAVH